jgi:hypothetical protein
MNTPINATNLQPPETIGGYTVHPVASLFPLLEGDAYQDLKKAIEQHGQQEPIVLQGNVLIDGRNRLKVLLDLRRQPVYQQYSSKLPVEEYILVQNLWRRDLTDDQRVMITTEIMLKRASEAALARQQQAGKQGGKGGRGKKKNAAPPTQETLAANSTQGFREPTVTEKVAVTAKSTYYQARQAVAVMRHAPELAEEVMTGALPLKEAHRTVSEMRSPPRRADSRYLDTKLRIIRNIHALMKKYPTCRHVLRKELGEAIARWDDRKPGLRMIGTIRD